MVEDVLDYSNYSLMKKNANAVSEALKHYPLPISSINLHNNAIKSKEAILLLNSLEAKMEKLQEINLSDNKVGVGGIQTIVNFLP